MEDNQKNHRTTKKQELHNRLSVLQLLCRIQIYKIPKYRLQNFQLLEALGQLLDGKVHLFLGVSGHQREAYQCILRMTCRRNNRIDEHTFIESHLGHFESLVCIAYVKRDDRAFSITDFETAFTEAVQCIVSDFPQFS